MNTPLPLHVKLRAGFFCGNGTHMDCYDRATRSKAMRSIQAKDTSPEIYVRRALFKAGFRFRLHNAKLPGKPDIILCKYRTIIFVNGCFWHRHPECEHATMPASNCDYWQKKFQRNVERDKEEIRQLENAGWNVLVVWECELKKPGKIGALIEEIRKHAVITGRQ